MKIGELATVTGVSTASIRFYEAEGLLPEPGRTDGNYRDYAAEHVERLHFVRRCRSLQMELDEIRTLLRFKDAPEGDCSGVNDVLDAHIGHVAARVRELRALESELKTLRRQCASVEAADRCAILQELSSGAEPVVPTGRRHVGGVHR